MFVAGPLLPSAIAARPEFQAARDLLEVHECLTLLTPWAGPVRVDVTWDPPLVRAGLPGDLDWDGERDMPLAVGDAGPGWSVSRRDLRRWKEALRARLYRAGEREVRDAAIAALVGLFPAARNGDMYFGPADAAPRA